MMSFEILATYLPNVDTLAERITYNFTEVKKFFQ